MLVERARRGDNRAFGILMEPYRDRLFAFVFRSVRDTDHANDLVQETLIRVWKGLASYEHRGRFVGWLFTITRTVVTDDARLRARRSSSSSALPEVPTGSADDPYEILAAADLREIIEASVHAMAEPRRTVFLLRQHSGLTFREIATQLGMPLGTALSHMHHAVQTLRRRLKEYHDPVE